MKTTEIFAHGVTIQLSADECAGIAEALAVASEHAHDQGGAAKAKYIEALHGAFQALAVGDMLSGWLLGKPQEAYETELDLLEIGVAVSLVPENQRHLLKPSNRNQPVEDLAQAAD